MFIHTYISIICALKIKYVMMNIYVHEVGRYYIRRYIRSYVGMYVHLHFIYKEIATGKNGDQRRGNTCHKKEKNPLIFIIILIYT